MRTILTTTVVLLAALAGDGALGAMVQVTPSLFASGDEAAEMGLAAAVVSVEFDSSAQGCDAADPPRPTPVGDHHQPARLRSTEGELQGVPLGLPTPTGTGGSPPSAPSGAASAIILTSVVGPSSPPLAGLLPNEMGPTISNPPPWAPLHPPRSFPRGGRVG